MAAAVRRKLNLRWCLWREAGRLDKQGVGTGGGGALVKAAIKAQVTSL